MFYVMQKQKIHSQFRRDTKDGDAFQYVLLETPYASAPAALEAARELTTKWQLECLVVEAKASVRLQATSGPVTL